MRLLHAALFRRILPAASELVGLPEKDGDAVPEKAAVPPFFLLSPFLVEEFANNSDFWFCEFVDLEKKG